MAGLAVRVGEIALVERTMRFTHPFRFGVARVEAAPQAFVRVRVSAAGRSARGCSAEMMMPKWFDKNPGKSPADTIADLRASLMHAADLYRQAGAEAQTPFALHAAIYPRQMAWARERGLPALVGAYGPAVIDRAVLDGALRCAGATLIDGLRGNLAGLDARLTPDLPDAAVAGFLSGLQPRGAVALRHTIGLADALEGPGSLDALLARTPLRFLKIKIGGDVEGDRDRLVAISRVLARRSPDFEATLDANEGYDVERLGHLAEILASDPHLAELRQRLLYIEQPLDRATTFASPLGTVADRFPFIIDEADGEYEAFPRARALGYRGVSAKGCKGFYKSVLNAARTAAWNEAEGAPGRYFVSAEDLTCQAGLAVQADTALVACLGLAHAERNGHHYVDGFGPAPAAEAAAFRAAHPDFYAAFPGETRGRAELPTASLLATPGFAGGPEPDWGATIPLTRNPETRALEEIAS